MLELHNIPSMGYTWLSPDANVSKLDVAYFGSMFEDLSVVINTKEPKCMVGKSVVCNRCEACAAISSGNL